MQIKKKKILKQLFLCGFSGCSRAVGGAAFESVSRFPCYRFSQGCPRVHRSPSISLQDLNCLHQLQNVGFSSPRQPVTFTIWASPAHLTGYTATRSSYKLIKQELVGPFWRSRYSRVLHHPSRLSAIIFISLPMKTATPLLPAIIH